MIVRLDGLWPYRRVRSKPFKIAVGLLTTVFWLIACQEEPQKAPVATTQANKTSKTSLPAEKETPAETSAAPVWTYSALGKRDPFRSYLAELQRAGQNKGAEKRAETQVYELSQYRLTGIVSGTAQPKAMVEDPDGKGHVLSIGTPLGKSGGRVTRISSSAIIVTEEYRSPTDELVRVPITIELPKPNLDLNEEP